MSKKDVHWFPLQRDGKGRLTIKLFDGRVGDRDEVRFVTIWAGVEQNGDVIIEGFDNGEYGEQSCGIEGIEGAMVMPAAEKDRLILFLLRELFAGNLAAAPIFKDFANANGLECIRRSTCDR
ncbi:hypothetical protein Deba_0399 [Desulfarculus baarsii DSM 2075]|uniref:Uncharacterized protein n=1 Tax=Desulfarculus baarsii (strain ATCC 33931 / DSM 2075 / LMG 7858 / VKM B-1802 / 2st14) TaxID=644282 RepID=E1QDY8_DESB2|nr:hypothetical protein [Desulfarculus baarsii]ADK83774.1 hypothetical protein Deba_0399 [Desulfarculus baarsii DSM 2075]